MLLDLADHRTDAGGGRRDRQPMNPKPACILRRRPEQHRCGEASRQVSRSL